jgi:hypothetical protein
MPVLFDKDETIKIVDAGQTIFTRFGSTRILALALTLLFLSACAWLDRALVVFYGSLGASAFTLTLYSLHTRPHADRQKEVQA